MSPEQFCYWLQGYVEISGRLPSPEEWTVIMDHLREVFHKVTPDRSTKKSARELLQEEIEKAKLARPEPFCGERIC